MIRLWAVLALLAACRDGESPAPVAEVEVAAPAALVTGPGVDIADRSIRVGALGCAGDAGAALVEPQLIGLRLVARVAASRGLLPDGWKLELVELGCGDGDGDGDGDADQRVLLAAAAGGAASGPRAERLRAAGVITFATAPSMALADEPGAVAVLPSPDIEAMRAVDFAVEDAGGAAAAHAAIVYGRGAYGADALAGFRRAAEHHELAAAGEHALEPDGDLRAVVRELAAAERTHVVVAVAPTQLAALVNAAAAARYRPMWLGTGASWTDYFFSPARAAGPEALAGFRWVSGLPYWGEDVPGMNLFLAAWDRHGQALGGSADFPVLAGYLTGLAQLELLAAGLGAGDLSRGGLQRALRSIDRFDAGGLIPPLDLSRPPPLATEVRVLAPIFATKSWRVVGDWARPAALSGARSDQ